MNTSTSRRKTADANIVRERPVSAAGDNKPKRPLLIGSGVLLAGLCVLVGAALFGANGQRRALVTASRAIPAGTVVTVDMLRVERLETSVQLVGIPGAQLGLLVGKTAIVPIAANSLVLAESLGSSQQPPAGFVLVGAVFEAGEYPIRELRYGDRIDLVKTPNDGSVDDGGVLAVASVWASSGDTQGGSSRRTFTLAVRSADEVAVVQGIARRELRMTLVSGKPVWLDSKEQSTQNKVAGTEPVNGTPTPSTASTLAPIPPEPNSGASPDSAVPGIEGIEPTASVDGSTQ
jgi:SAF domain